MNNSKFSKKIFIIIGILVFSVAQARWIPLNEAGIQREPEINVLSANEFFVDLNVKVFGLDVEEVDTKQITDRGTEVFALLSIDEYAYTGDIGKPKLPMVTTVLDVPHQARITVEVLDYDVTEIDLAAIGIDERIMPALASVPKIPNAKVQFIIDEKLYSTDNYFPDNIGTFEEHEGYARGHKLATLQVFPIHYNPVKNTIRYYSNIRIRVDFIGGNRAHTQRMIAKDYSVIWEDFIEKMVINYPNHLRGVAPLPIYYDIFYHGAFAEAAESLAHWKAKKGFKVRMWNAAGWSAGAIDDTIEAQTPIATYLVIIGDPNSSTPLPPSGTGSSSGDQTDLYYAETDGSGYLPDLFNARIAVLNPGEAHTVIQKALRYERANFGTAGTDWLKKACFIAGYDSYWQSFGMATNWYCRNLLVPHGYTVDTLVYAYGEQQGRVVDQINAGRAWCVYTAHGGQTEWWVGYSSDFNISELTTLTTNLDMYPMPVGHCCLAADYQYSTSCFGEVWDRLSGKGGICYFGSVPSTFWYEDDWLQRRYFDAIYADSVPGNLYETGRFTQWGLYWIENNTSTSFKRYYFEAYHLFNDPSLDFWTDIPDNMIVTHNPTVLPITDNFTVTVKDDDGITPLEDALVCCWIPNQSPQMHVSDYTDAAGTVTLSISPTTPGDTMYVTVTKHNYMPDEGYVLVSVASGPYVVTGSMVLDDGGGNGQANPGEAIDLGVWAQNIGVATAHGVYGLLSESDPYVTITTDSSWYGTIAPDDSSLSDPSYSFTIDNNCPNNHSIDFTLIFHDSNDSTWVSHPIVTVYAPVLTYEDVSVVNDNNSNGILDPGETADLVVTIENEGGAVAENVNAFLTTSSVDITINDGDATFGSIDPGNSANNSSNPFNVTADSLISSGTVVDFELEVVSGVYVDTLQFSLVVGQKHYYIWNPDPTPGSGENIHTILTDLGYAGDYGVAFTSNLGLYQSIYICVGMFSDNYVIEDGSPEAAALVDFLENQDGCMYLEGGDVWYYDPMHGGYDFGPLFGIVGIGDGSSDLSTVAGRSGTFTQGMSFGYGGDNSYVDHLTSTGTGYVIFKNASNSDSIGVANNAGTYRTVGTSFELGLLTDGTAPSTRAVLLDSIMDFFGIGTAVGIEEDEEVGSTPLRTALGILYPNPFHGQITISYQIAEVDKIRDVSLKIYDSAGRLVKQFNNLTIQPFNHITWSGRDDRGRVVPAGIYFVRFETDTYQQVEKAILLR